MTKPLKETISLIRRGGGTEISVRHLTRHRSIRFTAKGKRHRVLVHSGNHVTSRFEPMIRSELRKTGLDI